MAFTIHPSREPISTPGDETIPASVQIRPVKGGLLVQVHLRGDAKQEHERFLEAAVKMAREELHKPGADVFPQSGAEMTALLRLEEECVAKRPELLERLAAVLAELVNGDLLQNLMADWNARVRTEVAILERARTLDGEAAAKN